jgi:predicted ATPase
MLIWHGQFAGARHHIEQGLAIYSPAQHGDHAMTYAGHDPGVCAWAQGGLILWFLGFPDRAAEHVRRSLALAEQLGHPPTVAHALNYGIVLYQLLGDQMTVGAWSERMSRLAAEQRLGLQEATGIAARGWLLAMQGRPKDSQADLRRSLSECTDLGTRILEPYFKAMLAASHLDAGEAAIGLKTILEGIGCADESGLHYWDAELLRLKGKLLAALSPDRSGEAERCYRDALAVARRQQARSIELRAATSLARLWHGQGRREEARDLLAPVYGWFTEGFGTPDLIEAKALLDRLA